MKKHPVAVIALLITGTFNLGAFIYVAGHREYCTDQLFPRLSFRCECTGPDTCLDWPYALAAKQSQKKTE
jgi:hypothetical protein